MWSGSTLGRFCLILSTNLATVVPAGTEGEQNPFLAHTALAGAVLLITGPVTVCPWEKGALQGKEKLTAAVSHPCCVAGNASRKSD